MRRTLGLTLVALLCAPFVHAGASSDRELIGQLDREVIALKQRIKIFEEKLRACTSGGQVSNLHPELVQIFGGSTILVERVGAASRVTLPGDLLFAQGGVRIREEADATLDLLATALKIHMDVSTLVVGHTDSDPPPRALLKLYPSNWELSYARALAVTRELVEGHGVPYTRFTVAARADLEPVTGNDTPEGRATNRRIVFLLTPGVPQ
jgi:chemotaxis protein MotB